MEQQILDNISKLKTKTQGITLIESLKFNEITPKILNTFINKNYKDKTSYTLKTETNKKFDNLIKIIFSKIDINKNIDYLKILLKLEHKNISYFSKEQLENKEIINFNFEELYELSIKNFNEYSFYSNIMNFYKEQTKIDISNFLKSDKNFLNYIKYGLDININDKENEITIFWNNFDKQIIKKYLNRIDDSLKNEYLKDFNFKHLDSSIFKNLIKIPYKEQQQFFANKDELFKFYLSINNISNYYFEYDFVLDLYQYNNVVSSSILLKKEYNQQLQFRLNKNELKKNKTFDDLIYLLEHGISVTSFSFILFKQTFEELTSNNQDDSKIDLLASIVLKNINNTFNNISIFNKINPINFTMARFKKLIDFNVNTITSNEFNIQKIDVIKTQINILINVFVNEYLSTEKEVSEKQTTKKEEVKTYFFDTIFKKIINIQDVETKTLLYKYIVNLTKDMNSNVVSNKSIYKELLFTEDVFKEVLKNILLKESYNNNNIPSEMFQYITQDFFELLCLHDFRYINLFSKFSITEKFLQKFLNKFKSNKDFQLFYLKSQFKNIDYDIDFVIKLLDKNFSLLSYVNTEKIKDFEKLFNFIDEKSKNFTIGEYQKFISNQEIATIFTKIKENNDNIKKYIEQSQVTQELYI